MTENTKKRMRWFKRIQNARRYYAFQRWTDRKDDEKISLMQLTKWVFDDVNFLLKWNINLILQLRAYGSIVKRYSGLSFFQQWKRMAYIVFKFRADSSKFRYNHLFEEDRWEKADQFSYSRHNLIKRRIKGFFPKDDVEQIHNKFLFYKLSKKYGWNTPTIHAIYERGSLKFPKNGEISFPKRDLFIKNVDGGQGRGSKYFVYGNDKYRDLNGNEFNVDDLELYLRKNSKLREGLLIQDAEKNHEEWEKFSNGSLATCRIVTGRSLKDKTEIIPFFATLRMPVGKANADNYTLGGIASAIDIQTGLLGKAISCKPYKDSFSWDVHPDTNEKITGTVLFKWNELLEFTKKIHRKFKTLAVGWDLSLTTNGVCVIEGNPYWGAEVMESPANKTLYVSSYPVWVEECIEILSNTPSQNIWLDKELNDLKQ